MEGKGYTYKDGHYTLRILPYSDKIILITYGQEEGFPKNSLIVTATQPQGQIGEVVETDQYFFVWTAYLKLKIKKETLSIQYERIGQASPAAAHRSVDRINQASMDEINQASVDEINQTSVDGIYQASMDGINQTSVNGINQAGMNEILLSVESERIPRELEKYNIFRTVDGTASERVTVDGV